MKSCKIAVILLIALSFVVAVSAVAGKNDEKEKDETITAWGEVTVKLPVVGKIPTGIPTGLTISMKGDGYDVTLESGDDPVKCAFKDGRFEFYEVPCGENMQFEIVYEGTYRDEPVSYQAAMEFSRPDLNVVQKIFSKKKAEEIAGYIGDFVIDAARGDMKYESRYED